MLLLMFSGTRAQFLCAAALKRRHCGAGHSVQRISLLVSDSLTLPSSSTLFNLVRRSLANFHAAAAIGEALIKVLDDAAPRGETLFVDTTFVFAKDLKAPPPQGVTLYFYRVAMSASRQNFVVRENPDGTRSRPPLVVDLYYLLTGWSREDARRQAALLIWAMRMIEDLSSLPGAVINQRYGTEHPPFRPSESIQLAFESLTIQDQYNIWDAATRHNLQPSIGICARAVPIDTDAKEQAYAPAQSREFQFRPRSDT